MSTRCSSNAVTTNLVCRNKFTCIIDNRRYCHIHAKILINKSAVITIQKSWRGYKSRKRMTHIYIKLPDELQRKIIFYMREGDLIKKHHHDIIYNILKKRMNNKYLNLQIEVIKARLAIEYNDIEINDIDYFTENTIFSSSHNSIVRLAINKLMKTYSLYTKYCSIVPKDIIDYLRICCSEIICKFYFENYSESLIQFRELYDCIINFEIASDKYVKIE